VQQHFDSEQHSADRRIERRRDPRTATRGDERDPNAAPIWMIGPSRPTDPPLPIEIADATDFTAATIGRIAPPS
jgi:hypothetical protein